MFVGGGGVAGGGVVVVVEGVAEGEVEGEGDMDMVGGMVIVTEGEGEAAKVGEEDTLVGAPGAAGAGVVVTVDVDVAVGAREGEEEVVARPVEVSVVEVDEVQDNAPVAIKDAITAITSSRNRDFPEKIFILTSKNSIG